MAGRQTTANPVAVGPGGREWPGGRLPLTPGNPGSPGAGAVGPGGPGGREWRGVGVAIAMATPTGREDGNGRAADYR